MTAAQQTRRYRRALFVAAHELDHAAGEVCELACTCTPDQRRRYGHASGCMGLAYSRGYATASKRIRKLAEEEEDQP